MATSYLQNNYSRDLFLKRRLAIVRVLLNIICAVLLIVLDSHQKVVFIRDYLKDLSASVQLFSQAPIEWTVSTYDYFKNQKQLIDNNQLLTEEVLFLKSQIHALNVQQSRDKKIKSWLKKQDPTLKVLRTANLLSIEVNPSRQIYILNKGSKDGIFQNQVAIDGKGLLGQVIDVGRYTSSLLLITDIKSAVPVINQRTGEHGIVAGLNRLDELQLLNVSKTSQVRQGDVVVSSGLGLVYPYGIPVGVVKEVSNVPGEDFLLVLLTPLSELNKNHMVILLQSFKNIAIWRQQLAERMKALELGE